MAGPLGRSIAEASDTDAARQSSFDGSLHEVGRMRDAATHNQGKVQLGEGAPVFIPRAIRSGEKVVRDAATRNQGKVQLGEGAPVFGR